MGEKIQTQDPVPTPISSQALHAPSSLSPLPAHHMDTKAPEPCFLGPLTGDPASELAAAATGGPGTDWVGRAVSLLPATTAGEDPAPSGPGPAVLCRELPLPPQSLAHSPHPLSSLSQRTLHSQQPGTRRHGCPGRAIAAFPGPATPTNPHS